MATARLVSDELMLPDDSTQGSPATDSSRVLLGLMTLARQAEAAAANGNGDLLGGILSKTLLRSLMSALHYRDVSTVRHARRVALLAVGMAQYLSWEGRHLKLLEIAALLHDIGKIGVPDNILFKPGKLSEEESALMALHAQIGTDVLQACHVEREVIEIIAQSQAVQNGSRDGKFRAGGEIHLGARILAVADAYDSLSTDQVYRDGKPHEEIMKILMDAAGSKFDGNVVCALSRWVESEGLPFSRGGGETAGDAPPGATRPDEALEATSLGQIFSYLYVLESLYDGFYLVDSDLRYVVWNDGAERLLGRPASATIGQTWSRKQLGYADQFGNLLSERDCPMNRVISTGKPTIPTVQIQHADGRWIEVELQTVPLLDAQGKLQGVAEIFRDLTRSGSPSQDYRELKLAASRDPLTGVANRGELEKQLALMLSEHAQHPEMEPFSLLFLDLDYFKNVNDKHGHAAGDQVLADLAKVLQHETYSGELVARYGGEEFVILCPATEIDQALRRAERLRVAIPRTEVGGLKDQQVTASFGVTQVEPGDSVESILRRADKALYRAKQSGRNRSCSMTNQDLESEASPAGAGQRQSNNPFVYEGTFQACIAADMIVYKLGGFVNDVRARLIEVTPQRAVLRLGARGLLPFWGDSDDRRPVEIQIEFAEPPGSSKRAASRQVEVEVTIRPLGWIRNRDVFQTRARRVMKHLRSYFAAG